jgi:hypothetical protein
MINYLEYIVGEKSYSNLPLEEAIFDYDWFYSNYFDLFLDLEEINSSASIDVQYAQTKKDSVSLVSLMKSLKEDFQNVSGVNSLHDSFLDYTFANDFFQNDILYKKNTYYYFKLEMKLFLGLPKETPDGLKANYLVGKIFHSLS